MSLYSEAVAEIRGQYEKRQAQLDKRAKRALNSYRRHVVALMLQIKPAPVGEYLVNQLGSLERPSDGYPYNWPPLVQESQDLLMAAHRAEVLELPAGVETNYDRNGLGFQGESHRKAYAAWSEATNYRQKQRLDKL